MMFCVCLNTVRKNKEWKKADWKKAQNTEHEKETLES